MMSESRCLAYCLSLAAGEFLGMLAVIGADAWPVVAFAAVLTVLFGYGLSLRGWPYAFVALTGLALYFGASVESERRYRGQPWMRGARRGLRDEVVQGPVATAVRRDLSQRLGVGLAGDRPSVLLSRAILLGERSGMPITLKRAFVESGTIHLFAISGLHVMAVARVLSYVLALVVVPRRWCGALSLPFLWGYVHLIGWPPSAMRAALMASFAFLAPLCWRRPDLLRAWALTFLLVHLVDPLMLSDVGSLLSFAVMLAIALAVRVGEGAFSRRGLLLWVAFATWAAGVPIAAHAFGRVTPGGLLAGLVLIPVAAGVVYAGVTGLLASFVCLSLAVHLNNLSALGVKAMVVVAELVARVPGANLNVPPWGFGQCVAWYGALSLCFWLVWSRRRNLRILP